MTAQPTPTEHDVMAADTVDLCSRLITFDTSNFGGGDSRGERAAAEWVAETLADAGFAPTVLESAPGRASTVVRIPGTDPTAPALLVHGHLDVVPAEPADWSFDPFCGEVRDGAVWGRGALDMKDMDAMMLAVARSFGRTGHRPPRDIVMAFVADEEDTGVYGAGFLTEKHPELFEGVTTAISESGGYAVHLPNGTRLYPIATGERGSAWMTLTARGTAGHGSRRNPDNAVSTLVRVLAELADHPWPVHITPTVGALLDGLSAHLGVVIDPAEPASLAQLGEAARLVEATVSNSLNPTMLQAGYKHNVIPSEATAGVDGRILPGAEDAFFEVVDGILGSAVTREFASFAAPVSADHTTAEFAAMAAALRAHDPEALVLPFCMSGGTDAKAFARLGIAGYGFAPGTTPPGFSHWDFVHGVDERVLVDSLAFGVRVLDSYLRTDPRTGSAL
ncbi:M20/M25/M40 family metallo-hydrolase [Streptomyces sp. NPDC058691]|uniref:M20/M25/M40 family metallo-hydrolase n=1 Tax=Streptomyces sp. NPDC058691 TaxID=3346601 RepID=UPI00364D4B51